MFLKKKAQQKIDEATLYGFSFSNQPATVCSDRILTCALKGLFIFAAVYGTIGGLISSFHLPCHPIAIFVLLLFFSLLLAYLHYSRLIFNVCYPIVFLIFTYSIFTYRFYVYSGFQAFLNILQEEYSTYFDLSILREGNEYYMDRHMTITFASIFIGFFLIVLLNIAISEYMNLAFVILLTFPIFQLGIFINKLPDFPYLVLLLFSYFMVAVLKRSEHFLLPYREKERTEFAVKERNSMKQWRYHASGKVILQLTAVFFVFSLFLGIFCLPFLSATDNDGTKSSLRKTVDDYVKIYTQDGLAGFFNRYEASGGISGGQLGGVSSVRPDYETDLTVTFVPYSYETLYLKAYTGGNYTGSSWDPVDYNIELIKQQFGNNYEDYEEYTSFLESRRLAHYMKTNPGKGITGKISIKNVDANSDYFYLPYYCNNDFSAPYSSMYGVVMPIYPTESDELVISYYPLLSNYWDVAPQPDELLSSLSPNSNEAEYIRHYDVINGSYYLDMPQNTREGLEKIKKEIGSSANMNQQIFAIQEYLEKNYKYSMTPGKTPRDEDFALYFLEQQKSGYCAHFATAATLLLRSFGIPARYVEGYAVSIRQIAEGTAIDEPYEEWFQGENPIGETGVVSVDVTDGSAHAWVEVYKPGFGWVPYDFTPPDTDIEDETNTYSEFWSVFANLFGSNPPPEAVEDMPIERADESFIQKAFGNSSFLAKPLLYFAGVVLLLTFALLFGKTLLSYLRLRSSYLASDYAPYLSYWYRKLCKKLYKAGYLEKLNTLPLHLTELPFYPDEISAQMGVLEKCCYSQHTITKKEADALLGFLQKYVRSVKRKKEPKAPT